MTTRNLGSTGPATAPLGLGLMGMSGMYGPADRDEGIATVHAALDAGITLLDTGDFYGMGHNELLMRDALAARDRGEAIISVKFGALRDPANGWGGMDTRPEAVRNFVAYSLTGSAPTTSTSTGPRAWIPTSRSRRPSARSRRSSTRATCATSGSRRSARRRSAAPPPCTRSPTSRSSTR